MDKESRQSGDGGMAGGATDTTKKSSSPSYGVKGFVEVVIRVLALGGTLAAAIVMGRNKQTILVFGSAFQAKTSYSPALVFFVVANAIACGYVFLSVPFPLLKPKSHVAIKFLVFLLDLVIALLFNTLNFKDRILKS